MKWPRSSFALFASAGNATLTSPYYAVCFRPQDPASASPTALALLHSANVALGGAALPGPVADFAAKGFGLAAEHARHTRSSAAAAFHAELAEAVAYANGARWA